MNNACKQVYLNKGASSVGGLPSRKRKYKPMPALRVEIPKDNGKTRNLSIPTVIDRVIQQAISQKPSIIFEQQFSEYIFGFRPRRSCEQTIVKTLEFMNDGYT